MMLDNCLCCSSMTVVNSSSNVSADLEQSLSLWLDLCLITYTNMICLGGVPFCWQLNNIHLISLTCLLTNFYNSSAISRKNLLWRCILPLYENYSEMSELFWLGAEASYFSLFFYFFLQLEGVELVNRIPLVPSVSPRWGEIRNISLRITPDIANGEIGFISNLPIILSEPEDSPATLVSKPFYIVFCYGKLIWRRWSLLYSV